MWWLVGAATAGLMSAACGMNLGARVSRGGESIWQPAIFGWAFLFHGAAGLLALWMIMNAVR